MSNAEMIAEMMRVWNYIETRHQELYPNATNEELYQLSYKEMNRQLGL